MPRTSGISIYQGVAVGEAGGGSVHADAVHFDGSAFLSIASLTATDNFFASFSFWIKASGDPPNTLWLGNPDAFNNSGQIGNSLSPPTFSTGGNGEDYTYASAGTASILDGNWHNVIGTFDTNHGPDSKVLKFYIDDVDAALTNQSDEEAAFTNLYNALAFYLGSDSFGDNYIGDLADFWFAPGVSLLTGSDITEATRRLFISDTGKPVDPSGFPASAILFSGNAATFPTNQGSGGTFTLTGSLTNASTSPSD